MSRKNPRFHRTNPQLPAAVPNLWQVSVLGTIEGQLTVSNYYYADGGAALTGTSELTLGTGFRNFHLGDYRNLTSSDWTFTGLRIACLTSPTRVPVVDTTSAPLPGLGAAGHEPTTVAAIIARYTAFKGQSGRGHIAVPGIPTNFVSASSLTAAGLAQAALVATDLHTAFVQGGITFTPQLVSRRQLSGGIFGAAPVLTSTARSLLGTVRRRKIGRGK